MKRTIMNIECLLIDVETGENLKAQIIPSLGVATYKMLGVTDLYQVPEVEHANNVSIIVNQFKDDELTVSAINGGCIEFTNISEKKVIMPRKIKMQINTFDSVESEINE